MNKSLLVNLICIAVVVLGFALRDFAVGPHIVTMGFFAFSGAVTNWLAIHMLFERVPGLYGSGIIPLKFESFKTAIYDMVMTQFFSLEQIEKFASREAISDIDLDPVIEKVDYDQLFEGLIEAVNGSKLGNMLGMFGGSKALEPMREPFAKTMKDKLRAMTKDARFKEALVSQHPLHFDEHLQERIADMVNLRLQELTPDAVKRIVQDMIRSHLGWLVVWGGVFGGLIGLISSLALGGRGI